MSAAGEGVAERYRRLAIAVSRGAQATDCAGGAFGAAGYAAGDLAELPAAAVAGSFGCGNPTAVLDVRPGDRVLDLGSGAGIDLIISARRVGPSGRVYGLDMLDEMLALARRNLDDAGIRNAELLRGHIENIPLPAGSVDAVISNCVLALSSDRPAVFREVRRVLVGGGLLGISDLIVDSWLAVETRKTLMASVACASVPFSADEYLAELQNAGLVDATVTVTHQVAEGLHAAITQARAPGGVDEAAVPGPPGGLVIDALTAVDWPAVRRIYEQGIATGNATFETATPTWEQWDRAHLAHSRLVGRLGGQVVGWTALVPVSDRCVYAGVAENSIYIDEAVRGRGIGRALLTAVLASAEEQEIWTVQTGVFPENRASVALHMACGFRVVGTRERVGRLHGGWRDVLHLERRSRIAGTN